MINAGFGAIRASLSNGAQILLIGEALPTQQPLLHGSQSSLSPPSDAAAVAAASVSAKKRRVGACKQPLYCYPDNPMEGWTKVVAVQLAGDRNSSSHPSKKKKQKQQQGAVGRTEVHYLAPLLACSPSSSSPSSSSTVPVRSNLDLLQYLRSSQHLAQLQQSFQRVKRVVTFDSVFCVCHSPEDLSRNYIECSYGLTGCFGWVCLCALRACD